MVGKGDGGEGVGRGEVGDLAVGAGGEETVDFLLEVGEELGLFEFKLPQSDFGGAHAVFVGVGGWVGGGDRGGSNEVLDFYGWVGGWVAGREGGGGRTGCCGGGRPWLLGLGPPPQCKHRGYYY